MKNKNLKNLQRNPETKKIIKALGIKKEKEITYYTVKTAYSVRTKAQARELSKAQNETYSRLVEKWTKGFKLPKNFGKLKVDGKLVNF